MTTRISVLTTVLVASLAGVAAAQTRPAAPRPAEAAPPPVDERSAQETRQRLRDIFNQYPPSVVQVLRLDPSLLLQQDYVALYPALAAFLAQHPEVAHNPVFFLGGPVGQRFGEPETARAQAMRAMESVLIGVELMFGFMAAMAALTWLARAGIDHRRWVRATKIQTDAHTKIVDRLASNEDLLTYMQSPAGQRFLASSPVAIEAMPQAISAPFNRMLWSVQAGVVLATSGVGLWFARNNVIEEVAEALQVLAILTIALGVGFVLSALVSYLLSRQLGLIHPQSPHA